jgi:hypothetical protein
MAILSVPEIIELGDISTTLALNYQANGSLFGPRKTYTAPTTIATVTDALRWGWTANPDVTEVPASATLTVDTLGNTGDVCDVYVNEPGNQILLGSYTQLITDTTTALYAASLASALSANTYGYVIAVNNSTITITARPGLGALMNGENLSLDVELPLSFTQTPFSGGVTEYTNTAARGVANYLYWLCGQFALEGQYIITGVGGGSVVPINPSSTPTPLDFEVTPSSFISEGQSIASIPNFIGYNLLFVRNNVPQSIVDLGGSYYSWNKTTGTFTCYPAAAAGELFQLYPFI